MNIKVAFTLALTAAFIGIVANHAEAGKSKPDLVVSAVSAPSSVSSGETIAVSGIIKNQGKAGSAAFTVAAYLSASPSNTTGATLLGTQTISSLPAGASVTLAGSLTIPGTITTGTFYLVGVADSTKVISESNESNNTGASGAMTVKDTTPPAISGVTASSITASGAAPTWITDKLSTSQVEFGTTTAYGSMSALNTSMVTSHGVTLSGLAANTVYHFRVRSTDASGNTAVSGDYTLTTAAATAAAGTTYYVATTGSDANPGTATYPFRTISHGVGVLTPGDTLYILSGTYAEALLDNIPPGTSWSTPVTVAAAPGQTVTLKPDLGVEFVLHFQGPQQYIVIDGLILDGANTTYGVVKITWSVSGDPATAAHHIRLQNSEVRNAPGLGGQASGQGVLVAGQADWNEFINLHVHHNGLTQYDHGFYIQSSHNVVANCLIHDNAGYGVHLYNGYDRRTDNNVVRDNAIFNNGWRGILLGSGDGNIAYNNLVWNNRGGIRIAFSNPTNSQVYHNTVYGNTDWGILVQEGTGAVIRNNIVYANGTPEFQDTAAGSAIDHNLVGLNPNFVDAAAGDFHLRWGSAAIDTGTSIGAVTDDFDGTPRPQGPANDLGAFEVAF